MYLTPDSRSSAASQGIAVSGGARVPGGVADVKVAASVLATEVRSRWRLSSTDDKVVVLPILWTELGDEDIIKEGGDSEAADSYGPPCGANNDVLVLLEASSCLYAGEDVAVALERVR